MQTYDASRDTAEGLVEEQNLSLPYSTVFSYNGTVTIPHGASRVESSPPPAHAGTNACSCTYADANAYTASPCFAY